MNSPEPPSSPTMEILPEISVYFSNLIKEEGGHLIPTDCRQFNGRILCDIIA
jgi:hypothetical protein